MYDQLNLALNQSPIRDAAVYLNYGYNDGVDSPSDSARLIRELLGDTALDDRVVLDVGCGRGGTLAIVRQDHRPARTLGVDLSPVAVDFCRQRYPESEFLEGDAQALPLPEASVDVVLNLESALHYPDPLAFYREVRRVLRPGGHFLYGDVIARAELAERLQALRGLGFELESVRDITPEVLRSCERNGPRRLEAARSLGLDMRVLGIYFAAPGTKSFGWMRDGEKGYYLVRAAASYTGRPSL